MSDSTCVVPVGTARLRVDHSGDPAAPIHLVFLHAGVADRRMWADQQRALAARCHTLAYDRRGFGATEVVADAGTEPTGFSHVGDLIGLLDALRIDRAVLVGCSQGGRIAIDAALAHPARVRGLVLIAPALSGEPQPPASAFAPAIAQRFDELQAACDRGDMAAANELETRLWLDGPLQPPGRVGGAARALVLDMNAIALRRGTPAGEAEPPSARERLRELKMPTLLLCGSFDFPTQIALVGRMAQQIPGAHSQTIEGVAHLPSVERPQAVDAALERYLDALPPDA